MKRLQAFKYAIARHTLYFNGLIAMSKLSLIGLSALIIIGTHTLAHADCDGAEDQTSMNKCADEDFTQSEKILNSTYEKIESRLANDEKAMKLLITSQRAWIQYRDAECNFAASSVAGGSIQPMIFAMCQADLTKDRIIKFTAYLNCEEGDMSCPVPYGDSNSHEHL